MLAVRLVLWGLFPMLTIAHRCSSALYPENTLRAFIAAAELGADMREFDVRMTRDREVVVIHDATVNRTTDGRGLVAAISAQAHQVFGRRSAVRRGISRRAYSNARGSCRRRSAREVADDAGAIRDGR